jgi:hypothetical protein
VGLLLLHLVQGYLLFLLLLLLTQHWVLQVQGWLLLYLLYLLHLAILEWG